MVYTAPDKTQNMTMDWESLVFLKRRFVESPVGVLAPLDPASLSDMVKWSSSDDSVKTVESTFTSLLTECWHYGEETFKKVEAWCRLEARRNGLHLNLPDWTAMRAARLLDYRVGCAAGLGDYSGSPWYLRATSWINKKLLEIFGQKALFTSIPYVEEAFRTIFPVGFTEAIIEAETSDVLFIHDQLRETNPQMAEIVGNMRSEANELHLLLALVTRLSPFDSFMHRVRIHQRWNLLCIKYGRRGLLKTPKHLLRDLYDEWDLDLSL